MRGLPGAVSMAIYYQLWGFAGQRSRLADACDPEGEGNAVLYNRDLSAQSNGPRVELQAPRLAVAEHMPVVTITDYVTARVGVGRPVPPDCGSPRIKIKGASVDPVLVIERQSKQICAADRAGWELARGSKLQPYGFPVHHRNHVVGKAARPNTQSYGVSCASKEVCVATFTSQGRNILSMQQTRPEEWPFEEPPGAPPRLPEPREPGPGEAPPVPEPTPGPCPPECPPMP